MLVNLEITKGEHVRGASPVFMVSGPLGTLRVDVRLTYIPDAGDLGHINPTEGDAGEEKHQRKRREALVRRRRKGRDERKEPQQMSP